MNLKLYKDEKTLNNNSLILLEFCEESISKDKRLSIFKEKDYLHSYYISKEKKFQKGFLGLITKYFV